MNSVTCLSGAIALFMFILGGCANEGPSISSELAFVESKIDLGSLPEASPIMVELTLRNDTQQAYELRQLELSCGCLTSDFTSRSRP